MSSELFVFDNSFFFDPFAPLPGSALQENENPNDELDQIASVLLSPSVQLEFPGAEYSALEVKTEESCLDFDAFCGFGNKQSFSFLPQFDAVLESHNQILTLPENKMRRVCGTRDLQKMNLETRSVLSSSLLSADKAVVDEVNFKVGRYSAEERKERIDRYKAKRGQRNFNKTIKYTCRKTLADTRPRIRGRFARNEEAGEIRKATAPFQRYEDEDNVWIDGFHREEDDGIAPRRMFFNRSGSTQCHNFSY